MSMADNRKKRDDCLRSSLCIGNPLGHRNERVQYLLMNRDALSKERYGFALLFQHVFFPHLYLEVLLATELPPIRSFPSFHPHFTLYPQFAALGKFSAGTVYVVFPFQVIISLLLQYARSSRDGSHFFATSVCLRNNL